MNFDIQEFNNVGMISFLKGCRIDKYLYLINNSSAMRFSNGIQWKFTFLVVITVGPKQLPFFLR